jgi:hypothetical protein
MKTKALAAGLASTFGLLLACLPAQAIPRTFVSGSGGGGACTRAAPCATFQAAHDATDPNGEITCLNSADFGAVIISKSITIDCTGALGTITVSTGTGVAINGTGLSVRLRNLAIHGVGADSGFGINFCCSGALFVESCVVTNFATIGNTGIAGFVTSGTTTKLFVSDSIISNNSNIGIQLGIGFAGTGAVRATIDKVRMEKNGSSIFANGAIGGSTGLMVVHVRDSVFAGNVLSGIVASSAAGASTTAVTVDRSSSILNGQKSILSSGAPAFVLLGRSTVLSNGTGLSAESGGHILSYQNNHLTGNITDGTTTGVLNVK